MSTTSILENIQFGILADEEILAQSVCEVTNTKLSGPSSVYDDRMGVLENGKFCVTCGKNNKECIGHFGHIHLHVSIVHPLFHKSVLSILRCICYRCSKVLMTRDQFEFHGLLKHHKQSRFMRALKMLEKMDTCLSCRTVQPKYSISTTDKSIAMVFKVDGDVRKNTLYDYEIKKIFENMTEDDVALLGFDPKHSHPKSLIISVLPVLPPVARPYIISDHVTCDDDLTIQYLEIIKANTHLSTDGKTNTATNEMKRLRYIQSLKFRIKCLFDNSQERSKHSNGRPLKGIKKRLTGKEGQLRNNLMGKRVDKSARTVIGPDPTLKVNEIAIPYEIADILTYPVKVTEHNIEELSRMLYSHRVNYVIRKDSGLRINMKYALYKQRTRLQFGDYIRKTDGSYVFIKNEKQFFMLEDGDVIIRDGKEFREYEPPILKNFRLEIGDTVERKLQDGDIVLLNRQPTLHKGSMMAFNCRLRKGKTIRTNLAITKSFNADFDGDEMNIHAPNSVETETELRMLSSIQNHIISNQSNKPNIVIVQDGLLSGYVISGYDEPIPEHHVMSMIQVGGDEWISVFPKKRDLFKKKCPHLPPLSGKLLFSMLLPEDMFYRCGDVAIEEGILVKGTITKAQLGGSHSSLIAKLYHDYDPSRCERFINEVQFLGNAFLLYHGFSIGIQDCLIPSDARDKIEHSIQKHFVQTDLSYESLRTPNVLEMSISNILNNTRNACMKIAKDHLPTSNKFLTTVTSGSKGDYFNITQIMALLGQQNFQGQRIQPSLSSGKRTLPHFPLGEEDYDKNDHATKFKAQGFIRNSFLKGLDPMEFWFHAITGREGITDTAMKSVTWETTVILIENGEARYVRIGEWIDGLLALHPGEIEQHTQRQMEYLKLDTESEEVWIPTMDYEGNVSWGAVSAITRHDPGDVLYKIQTKSGRTVTITESKSLLIWQPELQQFREVLTPEIRVGDSVPITQTLMAPPVVKKTTTMLLEEEEEEEEEEDDPYHHFDMNHDNGIFLGLYLALYYNQDEKDANTIHMKFPHHRTIQMFFERWCQLHTVSWKRLSSWNMVIHLEKSSSFLRNFHRWMMCNDRQGTIHLPHDTFLGDATFIQGVLLGFFSQVFHLHARSTNENSPMSQYTTKMAFSVDVAEGIVMLCARVGIVLDILPVLPTTTSTSETMYHLRIRAPWLTIVDELLSHHVFSSTPYYCPESTTPRNMDDILHTSSCNDVMLDEIVSIDIISSSTHPKVYDLTIPSTFNFALANGLQVRDTATSGYIQRRMVKVAEDVQVKYDQTVRNSAGSILQFRYGYHNYEPAQSVITKDTEDGKMKMFFADVPSIVEKLNHRHDVVC